MWRERRTDPAGGGKTGARTVNARLSVAGAGAGPVITQSLHHLTARDRTGPETLQILGGLDERVPLALQAGELGRDEGQHHVSSRLGGQRNKVILVLSGILLLNVFPLPTLGDLGGFEDVNLSVLAVVVVAAELGAEHGVEAVDGVGGVPPLQDPPGRGRGEEVRRREGGRRRGAHTLQGIDDILAPI